MPTLSTMSSVYDQEFFRRIRERSYNSASIVLAHVFGEISCTSVIDVGGGIGTWAKAAADLGIMDVTLVDGHHINDDDLQVSSDLFSRQDLSVKLTLPRRADLAICMEVAEHLPHSRARGFVEDLCRLSDSILFSAALPYQGGDGHVNEAWAEYWCRLFGECGYDLFDFVRPLVWDNTDVEWWYRQNALFFSASKAKAPTPTSCARLDREFNKQPVTRIHPEAYIALAHSRRPDKFRNSPARDVQIYNNLRKGFDDIDDLGVGGEFDSVVRPELLDINNVQLRGVVVGPGRTGSTALAEILSEHPDVFCLNESHDLPLLISRFGSGLASTRDIVATWLSVEFSPGNRVADQNVARAGATQANLLLYLERLCAIHQQMNVADFQKYIVGYFNRITGRRILIDKTPDYAHYLENLLGLWPDLRIVLMVRDPAATALSMSQHEGYQALASAGEVAWSSLIASANTAVVKTKPGDITPYLDIWCARINAALDVASTLDQTQFLTLDYAQICKDPIAEGRRLLRFFGTDPNESWFALLAKKFTVRASQETEFQAIAKDHPGVQRVIARLSRR